MTADPSPGPTTRIDLVAPEDMDEEQRSLINETQSQLNLFQLLARHPEVLRRVKAVGSFANRDTALPVRDRELMILRISCLYQSEFEWGQHYQQAIDAGWTAEDCERVKRGPEADGWDEWTQALLAATDGLVQRATIPDEAWEVLRQTYSEELMLELVIFFGHYTMVAMFANTFGLSVMPGRPGFDDSGSVAQSD
jgi:alkylhydroperoxidase family enzyme